MYNVTPGVFSADKTTCFYYSVRHATLKSVVIVAIYTGSI